MRLSFDLGLHVDMSPYVSQGVMTAAAARARCTAFWGCYIVDQSVSWDVSLQESS